MCILSTSVVILGILILLFVFLETAGAFADEGTALLLRALFFDDEEFLNEVCDILQRFVGQPISKIGSLDIP